MRVRWSEPAADDLADISGYIRGDNAAAARRVAKTIYDGCESLIHFPHRGRKGKQAGTRERVFAPLPYLSVYRVQKDVVEILHIWHGAEDL
jgi:toxin ParE1/3/4